MKFEYSKKVYMLLSGEIAILRNEPEIDNNNLEAAFMHKFKPNELIGHIECVFPSKRPYDVYVSQDSSLLEINSQHFYHRFRKIIEQYYKEKFDFLKSHYIFQEWRYEYILGLLILMKESIFYLNQYVYKIGSFDNSLYLVKDGSVSIQKKVIQKNVNNRNHLYRDKVSKIWNYECEKKLLRTFSLKNMESQSKIKIVKN